MSQTQGPRLSVNINNETHRFITNMMVEDGLTATEIVHRALSAYAYATRQQARGREFAVLHKGKIRKMVEFL